MQLGTDNLSDLRAGQRAMAAPPLLSSAGLGWAGLRLGVWSDSVPQELVDPALPYHLLVLNTGPRPVVVHERADALRYTGLAQPRDFSLISAGELVSCRWEQPLSFARLDLAADFLEHVADQVNLPGADRVELIHLLHGHDPHVIQLGEWLIEEARSGGLGGALYADSLTNVLAVHLLRQYANTASGRALWRAPGRLSRQEIVRAIDYLHANLQRDVTLAELAGAVGVSPAHLTRLFKQATGRAPHQYVIYLRVQRARELLLGGDVPIREIATLAGFADQSHLMRHIRRILGVTPAALRAAR